MAGRLVLSENFFFYLFLLVYPRGLMCVWNALLLAL